MPVFFIDIDNGDHRIIDDQGAEFSDIRAAKMEAISVLPDLAKENIGRGEHRMFSSIVRDQEGHTLCRAMLALTVVHVTKAERR